LTQWTVEYTHEALEDLKDLDGNQRVQVLKAIKKASINPLPKSEGGYGNPLGNHIASKLSGYLKIKLLKLGLSVVYGIVRTDNVMKVIIISVRDDGAVYQMAQARIDKLRK
jgi:mRNA interferase RelE/StbE